MNKTLLLLLLIPLLTFSQSDINEENNLFNIEGILSCNVNTYHYNVKNYDAFRPRYQDLLMRLSGNLNLTLGKHLSIPIGINVSNQTVSYNLPTIPEESFFDYVRNPRNNIYVAPTYKWIKTHFGSHVPKYSELTVGDIQIFGLGFDINPGKFILSANYGTSQFAIEPDSITNNRGAYKQNIISGRVGLGKINGSKIVLNFVKIKDDVSSVNSRPIGVDPIEGFAISPLIEMRIAKKITLKTETAASLFTQNQLGDPFPFDVDIPEIITDFNSINLTSNVDIAHTSSLNWNGELFSIGGEIKYIGPGFIPIGYRFIEKDIFDYKINSSLKLFENKCIINGTYGIRTNNLQNTNLVSTKRFIGNVNVLMQLTKSLNVNINYNNFGFNNNAQNSQIIRIQMVNSALSISPSYQIQSSTKTHVISSNISVNKFEQFDIITDDFINTESQVLNMNYMIVFKDLPLNLLASLMSMDNNSDISNINMIQYSFTSSYKFLDKTLVPSLTIIFANLKVNEYTPDLKLNTQLKIKYKINDQLNCNISYLFKNYNYGSSKDAARLNESRLQFSISQRF